MSSGQTPTRIWDGGLESSVRPQRQAEPAAQQDLDLLGPPLCGVLACTDVELSEPMVQGRRVQGILALFALFGDRWGDTECSLVPDRISHVLHNGHTPVPSDSHLSGTGLAQLAPQGQGH